MCVSSSFAVRAEAMQAGSRGSASSLNPAFEGTWCLRPVQLLGGPRIECIRVHQGPGDDLGILTLDGGPAACAHARVWQQGDVTPAHKSSCVLRAVADP